MPRDAVTGQPLPRARGSEHSHPSRAPAASSLATQRSPVLPQRTLTQRASARFTRVRPLQSATSTQLLRVEGPSTQTRGGCDLWALLGKGAGGWAHGRTCRNLRKPMGSLFLLRAPGFWHLGIPQCPTFKAVNSESFQAFPAAALGITSTLPVTPPNPMFPHSLPGFLQIRGGEALPQSPRVSPSLGQAGV